MNRASSPSVAGSSTSIRLVRRIRSAREFIGDTIESLRTYDPATQRSIEAIDQAPIVPLQELVSSESASSTDLW